MAFRLLSGGHPVPHERSSIHRTSIVSANLEAFISPGSAPPASNVYNKPLGFTLGAVQAAPFLPPSRLISLSKEPTLLIYHGGTGQHQSCLVSFLQVLCFPVFLLFLVFFLWILLVCGSLGLILLWFEVISWYKGSEKNSGVWKTLVRPGRSNIRS